MLDFKYWLENNVELKDLNFHNDFEDEFQIPDEEVMKKSIEKPVKVYLIPNFRGDFYRFFMPMGDIIDVVIKFGGIIGLKAAVGSLNSRCFELFKQKKYDKLYDVIKFVYSNYNPKIRQQIISYNRKG